MSSSVVISIRRMLVSRIRLGQVCLYEIGALRSSNTSLTTRFASSLCQILLKFSSTSRAMAGRFNPLPSDTRSIGDEVPLSARTCSGFQGFSGFYTGRSANRGRFQERASLALLPIMTVGAFSHCVLCFVYHDASVVNSVTLLAFETCAVFCGALANSLGMQDFDIPPFCPPPIYKAFRREWFPRSLRVGSLLGFSARSRFKGVPGALAALFSRNLGCALMGWA